MLQIIGTDSPVIQGLGVSDSFQEEVPLVEHNIISQDTVEVVGNLSEKTVVDVIDQGPVKSKKSIAVKRNVVESEDIEELKKKKLKLQIEEIKMRKYKLQLEIFEKEKSLGISKSKYTDFMEDNFVVIEDCDNIL